LGNSTLGHAHLNLIKCPLYAEITGPISCRFSVLLFNVQAQAFVTPAYQDGIRDLVWDATGTTTPPEMIGALGEERTWAGTLVIDPTMPSQFPTSHGWWSPRLTASFRFDNGDILDKELFATFYVLTDPAAPENDRVPFLSARISPHETRHGENWGQNLVETLRGTVQFLPLVPLKPGETFRTIFATGGYGAEPAARDGGAARRLRYSSPSARPRAPGNHAGKEHRDSLGLRRRRDGTGHAQGDHRASANWLVRRSGRRHAARVRCESRDDRAATTSATAAAGARVAIVGVGDVEREL
jgi:hypothetical protein